MCGALCWTDPEMLFQPAGLDAHFRFKMCRVSLGMQIVSFSALMV